MQDQYLDVVQNKNVFYLVAGTAMLKTFYSQFFFHGEGKFSEYHYYVHTISENPFVEIVMIFVQLSSKPFCMFISWSLTMCTCSQDLIYHHEVYFKGVMAQP